MGSKKDKDEVVWVAYLNKIDKQHDKLEEKMDVVIIKVNDIHHELSRNTDSLVIHEHRTTLAEKRLEHIERHAARIDFIIDILKPTKTKLAVILVIASIACGTIDFNSKIPWTKQLIELIK